MQDLKDIVGVEKIEKEVKSKFRIGARILFSIILHPWRSVGVVVSLLVIFLWNIVQIYEVPLNPDLDSVITFFYFLLTLFSTIGFGDITPQSDVGRIVIMSVGVLFIFFILGVLAAFGQKIWTKIMDIIKKVIVMFMRSHRIIISDDPDRAQFHVERFLSYDDSVSEVIVCTPERISFDNVGGKSIVVSHIYSISHIERLVRKLNFKTARSVTVEVGNDMDANSICSEIRTVDQSVRLVVTLQKNRSERTFQRQFEPITCLAPLRVVTANAAATAPGSHEDYIDSCSEGGSVDGRNIVVPEGFISIHLEYLHESLKSMTKTNMPILYILRNGVRHSIPDLDFEIKAGDELGVRVKPGFDESVIKWGEIVIKK